MNSYIQSSELNEKLEKMGLKHFVLNAANRDIDQPFHWSDLLVPGNAKKLWGEEDVGYMESYWEDQSENLFYEMRQDNTSWKEWLLEELNAK